MTAGTAELGDVDAAFMAALEQDAGTPEQPAPAAAPPRKSDNPDAPHGYEADGTTPKAPYGHKADGRPRIKPGGPGRGSRGTGDDKARVAARPASSPSSPSSGPAAISADYTGQLEDLGTSVWLAASMLRGGRLFMLPVPDTRPYAAVWRQQSPGLVSAWNVAAKQNAAVRGYLDRLSGDGAWSWKVGVGVTMVGLVSACLEMAKADPAVKAAAAAANDAELERFMLDQIAELGLEDAGQAAAG